MRACPLSQISRREEPAPPRHGAAHPEADSDSWPSHLSEPALQVTVAQVPTRQSAPPERLRPRPRRALGGPACTRQVQAEASEAGGPGGAASPRDHTRRSRPMWRVGFSDSPAGSRPGGPALLGSGTAVALFRSRGRDLSDVVRDSAAGYGRAYAGAALPARAVGRATGLGISCNARPHGPPPEGRRRSRAHGGARRPPCPRRRPPCPIHPQCVPSESDIRVSGSAARARCRRTSVPPQPGARVGRVPPGGHNRADPSHIASALALPAGATFLACDLG